MKPFLLGLALAAALAAAVAGLGAQQGPAQQPVTVNTVATTTPPQHDIGMT